ncbi:MAG TPA: hypothetical protein VNU97_06965 [Rhizomicrobium sp.]|jgi:hypothetical protein|nr:hypothetical protein [Rhizomicrobium sp.]
MDLALALNIATTVAVVGGVIFGAWQIRVAARARATQVSLHLVEMLNSRDLMEGLSALNDLPEGLTWSQLQTQLGERWTAVFTLINTLDGLGILVFRKEVAPDVADDFFHHAIAIVWQKTRAAIVDRRQQPGRETGFRFLEWLAEAKTRRTAPDAA